VTPTPATTPPRATASKRLSSLCRLFDDGRCQIAQHAVCPFGGRGAGVCSWHSIEVQTSNPTHLHPFA